MKEKLLKALELDKNGDWQGAHQIVQDIGNQPAYWIHAYLHREEPDLNNAAFWYSRAKKNMPEYSSEQEWQEIYDAISRADI
ncbi:MAG TPA: hypothetical protein VKA38_11940 [Draconibacterium sp.]|nr:hypothetical protein [Draconibacterium sp.]